MMKKLLLFFVIALTYVGVSGQATDLFFSEYIEGSGNNKALEIFNGTGAAVDLTGYVVKSASNGGDWNNILDMTGTLADGDVYVIYNSQADQDIKDVGDISSSVTYYNGNDAVALFKNTVLIDGIGTQGEDKYWDVAEVSEATGEHTLVRKSSVTAGNTNWNASSGTTIENSEWVVFNQDDFSHLGSHTMDAVALSTETDILTFVLAEQTGAATISTVDHTVAIEVTNGTVVTALVPTITVSEGATIAPLSGVSQNFTDAVTYTVTAEDTETTQPWIVTVTVAELLSSEAEILTFAFDEETEDAVINSVAGTIASVVAWDTDVTKLTPTFSISASAQVSATIDEDFTDPFTIKVQAQDKVTIKDWIVTVTKAAEPSHDAEILTFVLEELAADAVINSTTATITGELVAGTDASALIPTITVSEGAQVTPTVAQDFTADVVYTVTAEDGTTDKEWTVTLTVKATEMVSIYDIQYTTDASGNSPLLGSVVKTAGIVTGIDDYGFYMQDSAKAWNGIYINFYDLGDAAKIGDSVIVQGLVYEYFGLTQLKSVDTLLVVNSNNTIPNVIDLTIPDVEEMYESVLVKTVDLTCINTELYYDGWTVANGSDSIYIGTAIYAFTPKLNQTFPSITGIVTFKRDYFRIEPREAADLILGLDENMLQVVEMYPNPVSERLTITNVDVVSEVVISNIIGQVVSTTKVAGSKIQIETSNLETGIYIVTLVSNNGELRSERIIKQ